MRSALIHTSSEVCYLHISVCVFVGQSPYHDNDQGVCGCPCGATQAFISKSFTHTNTHRETRSRRYLMELNVTLPLRWITSIPFNPYSLSKAQRYSYSSNRLLSPTVTWTALNLSVKATAQPKITIWSSSSFFLLVTKQYEIDPFFHKQVHLLWKKY